MCKDVPMVSCKSASGDVAADCMCHRETEGPSDALRSNKTYNSWSEIVDDVVDQYDEALGLLSK